MYNWCRNKYSHKVMSARCPSRSTLPFSTLYHQAPLSSSFQVGLVNGNPWPKFGGMGKSEVKVFILLFPSIWGPFELAVSDNCQSLFYPRRPALQQYNSFSFKVPTTSLSSHHLVPRSGESVTWSASNSCWFPFAIPTIVISPYVNKCSLIHPFLSCWDWY